MGVDPIQKNHNMFFSAKNNPMLSKGNLKGLIVQVMMQEGQLVVGTKLKMDEKLLSSVNSLIKNLMLTNDELRQTISENKVASDNKFVSENNFVSEKFESSFSYKTVRLEENEQGGFVATIESNNGEVKEISLQLTEEQVKLLKDITELFRQQIVLPSTVAQNHEDEYLQEKETVLKTDIESKGQSAKRSFSYLQEGDASDAMSSTQAQAIRNLEETASIANKARKQKKELEKSIKEDDQKQAILKDDLEIDERVKDTLK